MEKITMSRAEKRRDEAVKKAEKRHQSICLHCRRPLTKEEYGDGNAYCPDCKEYAEKDAQALRDAENRDFVRLSAACIKDAIDAYKVALHTLYTVMIDGENDASTPAKDAFIEAQAFEKWIKSDDFAMLSLGAVDPKNVIRLLRKEEALSVFAEWQAESGFAEIYLDKLKKAINEAEKRGASAKVKEAEDREEFRELVKSIAEREFELKLLKQRREAMIKQDAVTKQDKAMYELLARMLKEVGRNVKSRNKENSDTQEVLGLLGISAERSDELSDEGLSSVSVSELDPHEEGSGQDEGDI